jgi:hypothetical protein
MVTADLFRRLRSRTSRMTKNDVLSALASLEEVKALMVKRHNSFNGEFLEVLSDTCQLQPLIK